MMALGKVLDTGNAEAVTPTGSRRCVHCLRSFVCADFVRRPVCTRCLTVEAALNPAG